MKYQTTQPLDAEEARVALALARLGDASPTSALDTRIRGQAHAAVLRRRPLRRWGGALAAVLALGVGIKVSLSPIPMQAGIVPDPSALEDSSSPATITPAPTARARAANQAEPDWPTINQVPADQPRLDKAQADEARRAPALLPQAASAPPADASGGSEAKQPSSPKTDARVQPASIPISPVKLESPPPLHDADNLVDAGAGNTNARPQPFPKEPPQRTLQAAPPSELDRAEARSIEARAAPQRSDAATPPARLQSAPRAPAMQAAPSPTATPAGEAPAAPATDQQPDRFKRQAFGSEGSTDVGQIGSAAKLKEQPSDSIAADAEGELSTLVELSALIERARQLARDGDAKSLKEVLRRITRDYPQAELPDDVRAMLQAERSLR